MTLLGRVKGCFYCHFCEDLSYRWHIIFSAYLSVLVGLVEAVLSSLIGHQETSMSQYGVALMALLDITGSLLILALWQCKNRDSSDLKTKITEITYTIIIGILMVLLGLFLLVDSVFKLSTEAEPSSESSVIGLVITIFSAVGGLMLASYKYTVGVAVDSKVVVADSISTFCSSLSSFAALIVILLDNEFWWSDSLTGFGVSTYTLYSGMVTVFDSYNIYKRLVWISTQPGISDKEASVLNGSRYGYQTVSADSDDATYPPHRPNKIVEAKKTKKGFIATVKQAAIGGMGQHILSSAESDDDENDIYYA